MAATLQVGQRVLLSLRNLKGTIRFIGETKFAPGKWIGVELDEPEGKNNGSLQGETYFSCPDNHGMFLMPDQVKPLTSESAAPPPAATPPKPAASGLKKPTPVAAAKPGAKTPAPAPAKPASKLPAAKSVSTSALPKAGASALPRKAPTAPLPSAAAAAAAAPAPVAFSEEPDDYSPPQSAPASASLPPSATLPTPAATSFSSQPSSATIGLATPAPVSAISSAASLPLSSYTPRHVNVDDRITAYEAQARRDAERIAELEKYRAQALQLTEMKESLHASQKQLEDQLLVQIQMKTNTEAKRDVEMDAMRHTVELTMIDKEIAEEKCRALEDQLLDMKTVLAALKAQVAQGTPMTDNLVTNTNNAAAVEISVQSNRMRGALIKLHESNDLLSQELSAANDELNEQRARVHALTVQLEQKNQKLVLAEAEASKAKDKLASCSEAMVAQLTERNIFLEDRVRKMTEEREDMLLLLSLDDEFEDLMTSSTTETQASIDRARTKGTDMHKAIAILAKQNEEHRLVIEKFREKCQRLEVEATALKEREAELVAEASSLRSIDASTSSAKMNAAVFKDKAKQLERTLMELDSEQAQTQIKLLQQFMPETLFKLDHEGLQCFSHLTRIAKTSSLAAVFVREMFRMDEDVARLLTEGEMTVDQYAFACDLNDLFVALRVASQGYIKRLEVSRAAAFHAMAPFLPEIAAIERNLLTVVHKLTGDGIEPHTPHTELRSAVSRLNTIVAQQFGNTALLTPEDHLALSMETVFASSESIVAQLQAIRNVATLGEGQVELPLEQLLESLRSGEDTSAALKLAAKKVLRKLPAAGADVMLQLNDDVRDETQDASNNILSISNQLRLTLLAMREHRFGSGPPKSLSFDTAVQIAVSNRLDLTKDGAITQKARSEGADNSAAPVHFAFLVDHTKDLLDAVGSSLANGEYDRPAEPRNRSLPPWEQRAEETRVALQESLGLSHQLEAKQAEVKHVRAALHTRERELSEAQAIAETSTKRIESIKSDFEKHIVKLEANIEMLSKAVHVKEEELQHATQKLMQEIRDVEHERDQLRHKLSSIPKGRRGHGQNTSAEILAAHDQIDTLHYTLTAVRAECADLRAKTLRSQLEDLPPLHVPGTAPPSVARLERESGALLEQLQLAAATARVVDVTRDAAKPPRTQLADAEAELAVMTRKNRVLRLNAQQSLASSHEPDTALHRLLTAPTVHVGRVRFPSETVTRGGRYTVAVSPLQLAALHASLVA